jgi:hypothetical protein
LGYQRYRFGDRWSKNGSLFFLPALTELVKDPGQGIDLPSCELHGRAVNDSPNDKHGANLEPALSIQPDLRD